MPRPYKNGIFIYPPRPEHCISSDNLNKFDNNEYIAEPKLNGSSCGLYINADSYYQKNRHGSSIVNFKMSDKEIISLYRGTGDMLLEGEYMNKNQNDSSGKPFNIKYVIWDILVLNGQYLVGTTVEERLNLLMETFQPKEYDEFLYQISENVFMVKSFENNFLELYNKITKIDMYEGWVLKRKNALLERGTREVNNAGWQLKARKSSKLYPF